MSEFYACAAFIDRHGMYTKYTSIILTIELERQKINGVIWRLRRFSGFGIETQIANLERCRRQLSDLQDDVREEWNTLKIITDKIKEKETRAAWILGSVQGTVRLAEYSYTEEPPESRSFSEIYFEILKTFTKFGKNVSKIITEILKLDFLEKFDFLDKWGGLPGEIKDIFSNYISPAFEGLNMINKVRDTIGYYTDGEVSFLDLVSTANNSESFLKSVLKISEKVADVKLIPNTDVPINKTVQIGGKYVGNITQFLPVAEVFFATMVSGAETYERVSADGNVSSMDWAEIGIDASVDGLYVCGEALLCIACPPAAIGVAVFEILDFAAEKLGGKSIKDWTKDAIKSGADYIGGKLRDAKNFICGLVGC